MFVFLLQSGNLVLKLQDGCLLINDFLSETFIFVFNLVMLVLYNSLFVTMLGYFTIKFLLVPLL